MMRKYQQNQTRMNCFREVRKYTKQNHQQNQDKQGPRKLEQEREDNMTQKYQQNQTRMNCLSEIWKNTNKPGRAVSKNYGEKSTKLSMKPRQTGAEKVTARTRGQYQQNQYGEIRKHTNKTINKTRTNGIEKVTARSREDYNIKHQNQSKDELLKRIMERN